ncbi:MAG: Na+/proline symporter [Candidatus Midichloriaceae bacterium]
MVVTINILDITIVGLYLFVCLVIGFYNSGKIKNLKEYTVGNRNFPTAILVATIFATSIGAHATIGTVDLIYRVGIVFLVARLCLPISLFILSYLFANNLQKFSHLISFTDIMKELYGEIGCTITKVLLLCYNIGILAGQAISIGYLFNYFFGMTYFWGIILGFGVITIYSSLGGILAVAFTDFFQFTIFFIALPVACGVAYNDMGGYENIIKQIPATHFSLDYVKNDFTLYLCMMLYFLVIPIPNQIADFRI